MISIYPQASEIRKLLQSIEDSCEKDELKAATYEALRLEEECTKLFEYLYKISK